VQDLDAVREALGYTQLNVYGSSYGTRVALHYLRRYPENTRTVMIDGVVGPEEPVGAEIASDAQVALDAVFARCAADAACDERFPDLPSMFDTLMASVTESPRTLSLPDPLTGESTEIRLGALETAMAFRLLSYSPITIALMPMLIDRAVNHDDFTPLAAQAMMTSQQLGEMLSYGMHNSVVCAEDVPFYDGFVQRAALSRTFLGETQVDALAAICDVWPRGVMDPDFKDPVRSDKPVLVLSGEVDPVTPPRNGDRAIGPNDAPYLTNAMHIVVPGQGHGVAATGCGPRVLNDFIENASLEGLDVECMQLPGPSPFFHSLIGPTP